MAQRLLYPDDGNVEFQAESLNGDIKSLYAHRVILATRCKYYETSKLLQSVFNCSV